MKPVFEYSDLLNAPYEAFLFDAETSGVFPVGSHWHYFMEILYMVEGHAYVEAGGCCYVLDPGDLMVFYAQVPHSIGVSGTFPLRYKVLKFDPARLNIPGSSLPSISHIVWLLRNTPEMSPCFRSAELAEIPMDALFERCIQVVSHKQFGYDIQAHALYCLILSELLALWQKRGFRLGAEPAGRPRGDLLASVGEYINCHYAEPLRVEQLAARFGMSYSGFAARFREYYGMSCNAFVQRVRVNKAEELLCQTDYDLTTISQETGFCDCSHLIRVFRQVNGVTPLQFRKAQRCARERG
ncbi:AraC family transcriptional regulator [uncultured Gemmiger sp.]|uniref:AraC family transcriptional regulator n=1 Tax=uncultured Gemmiger sp. TaxID=1623490 RepID=UPI0025FF63E0|nr:AraC family transcriptional regulator [uncultured Gemmiger sp.]